MPSLQFRRGTSAQRPSITPLQGEPLWDTDTKTLWVGDGITPGGVIPVNAAVPDGNKGEITVTSGAWAINNGAIGNAKLATMASGLIKARISGNSGPPEDATPAQIRSLLNVADGATANATDAQLRDRSTHTGTQPSSSIVVTAQNRILGRATSGSGPAEELTIGSGLTLTGSVLSATGGGGGSLSDGDKGDITVSGTGTVWTIDPGVVTNAKQGSMPNGTIKARISLGAGAPEDATPAQIRTLLNVADGATANASDIQLRDRSTHTGTQPTNTVAFTNTGRLLGRATASGGPAEEITLGSGLSFSGTTLNATTGGSITVQDEGSTLTTAATSFNFTGTGVTTTNTGGAVTINVPGSGAASITIQDEGSTVTSSVTSINFVGNAFTASAAGSVVTVTSPTLAGIATSASAGDLTTGTLAAARLPAFTGGDVTSSAGSAALIIANNAVGLGKIQQIGTNSILGRATAGAGNPEVLTPAQVRAILNVADGATANSADAVLTNRANHTGTQASSSITFSNTARLLGRASAGSGTAEEISLGSGLSLSGSTLTATGVGLTAAQLINSLSPEIGLLQRSTGGNLVEFHRKDSPIFDYIQPSIPTDITPIQILPTDSLATIQNTISTAPAGSWFYFRASGGAPTVYQEFTATPPANSVFIGERDASGNRLVRLSGAKDVKGLTNSLFSGTAGTNGVYRWTGRSERPTSYAPVYDVRYISGGSGYTTGGTWTCTNGASGTYTVSGGVPATFTVSAGGSASVTENSVVTLSGPGSGAVVKAYRGSSADANPPSPYVRAGYCPIIQIEKAGVFYTCPPVDSLADCQANTLTYWFDYAASELYINTGTLGAPATCDGIWLPTTRRALSATNTTRTHPLNAGGRTDVVISGFIVENYWSDTIQEGPFFRTGSTDFVSFVQDNYNSPARQGIIDNEIRYCSSGPHLSTGSICRRNYIHHNYNLNLSGSGCNIYIEGNRVQFGNNFHPTLKFSSVWESGNTKFANTMGCVIVNNLFSDANGKGIWFDIRNEKAVVAFNVCENNADSGIMYEVSWGGVIAYNWVYKNGYTGPDAIPANPVNNFANIYISSSNDVEVYGNMVWCGGPTGSQSTYGHGIIAEVQNRSTERASYRGGTILTSGVAPSMWGVRVHHNTTVFPTAVSSQSANTLGLTGIFFDGSTWTNFGYATNVMPPHFVGGPDAGNGNWFYNEYYWVSTATETSQRHWRIGKQFNGGWNQTLAQACAVRRTVDTDYPHIGQFYGSRIVSPGTLPADPGYMQSSWTPSQKIVGMLNSPWIAKT